MFIIELTYKVPLEQIDAHLESHVAFLDKHYKERTFIASGRKVPRDGGIILATATDRAAVESIIAEDPFYQHELADYTITEFVASKKATHIDELIA